MGGHLLGAEKLGPTAETARKWVRRAEIDGGTRPGVTSEEAAEIKRLKRENAESCPRHFFRRHIGCERERQRRKRVAMRELEADYLVVGAGASGMGFVDALIAESDAEVVIVDRRHRPGGHWRDAYPFVRLHNASAIYGVSSRRLGEDRIDETGPNAGFYERAAAAQVCDHYDRALEEHLLPSGQVRFLGMSEYRGESADGHHLTSLVTGAETTVKVRRKLVDATYLESSIPSKHTPGFEVDPGVRVIPPNDLVELSEPATGFTVLGAGKTAMDTCTWLLEAGVEPDAIRWIRPSDPWTMNRAFVQPLDLVGSSFVQLQARWVEAAGLAADGPEFAHRLEEAGVFRRIDPTVEPEAFRGAILSTNELESLRQIENVVRGGKVRRIGTDRVVLEQESIPVDAGQVYVDCTAAGVPATVPRPIFEPDRITMQLATIGNFSWSAATLGAVEALREDVADQNRLCPPVVFTGRAKDLLHLSHSGISGQMARAMEPDLAGWNERTRVNPARGVADRRDDPQVAEAFASIAANTFPAMQNLERRIPTPAAPPS